MVPDIYHILVRGKGIFTNVSLGNTKAKLRLLYEVAPIGLIIEVEGGRAIHESGTNVLDVKIEYLDQCFGACMGTVVLMRLKSTNSSCLLQRDKYINVNFNAH